MSLILKTTTLTFGKNQLVRSSPLICRTPFSTLMMTTTENEEEVVPDIEDLHFQALKLGSRTYIDPGTEFTVFTELSHLKRGTCCGNICRHCPYGLENVRNATTRPAKLRSGDFDTADKLIRAIQEGKPIMDTPLSPPKQQKQRASVSTARTSTTTTATEKNVPYTRAGDGGSSQLATGERRAKDDRNFEALGTVDELCSVVGVVHALLEDDVDYGNMPELMLDVMSRLFDIGSHVAKPTTTFSPNGVGDGFDPKDVDELENWINTMTNDLPELTSFILPTGHKAAAQLHVARTVCRRAERRMVPLVRDDKTCDPNALRYLNRLSDFFFVAARWVNYCHDLEEIQYQRDSPDGMQRQRVSRSLK
jgi:cob(I)alamin adenosyltransferase